MVRLTPVTFFRPVSVTDDARAKHTDNETERMATAHGALLHRSMTRVQTDLGVGDENNWTWIGNLPVNLYPRTTWTATANSEGRDRKFRVMGVAHGMGIGKWQIALVEE